MVQKVIQIGNSTGVIIPKSFLDKYDLKPGSEIILEEDIEGHGITIQKKGVKTQKTSITPHFLSILDKVNKQYAKALKELAQK